MTDEEAEPTHVNTVELRAVAEAAEALDSYQLNGGLGCDEAKANKALEAARALDQQNLVTSPEESGGEQEGGE